jgi:predicted phage-related endonuclease
VQHPAVASLHLGGQSELIILETRFWEHVEADTPPPADGSASAAQALRQLYPGNDTSLDFTDEPALNTAFDTLVALRAELDSTEGRAEQLKQTIQAAMGDASKARFARGEVTFKRAKDGTTVDLKRLAAEHPAIASHYTVPRPGARRFVLAPATIDTERTPPC